MTKDELIKALKRHMGVMESWAGEVSDEKIDGADLRAQFVSDLERAEELRATDPTPETSMLRHQEGG